jgi:hypothetical protein
MSKTTKDGMVWYTQGELDAKIIIAEHDREKQTLTEVLKRYKDTENYEHITGDEFKEWLEQKIKAME